MTVSKEWLHTKRTTLHFVVRNKQCFPLLLGTKNTFRIFILFSETKSAFISDKNFSTLFPISTFPFVVRNEQRFKNLHGVVGNKECLIAYLQSEILIFLAFVSLGDLTFFFFSGNINKILGNMTQVSGNMTSGKMTFRWLDQFPLSKNVTH